MGEFVGVLENGIAAGAKLTELTDEVRAAASEVDDVDVAATGAGGGVESSDMRMSSLKFQNASPCAGRSAGARAVELLGTGTGGSIISTEE